jgi:RimJ/RimL family protein N-acetyltransferase
LIEEIEHVRNNFPLYSQRLALRPFEPRDAVPFARYRSDVDVARYQSWEAPYSLAQAEAFVAALQHSEPGMPGEWYQLALEVKETGEMIGDVGFVLLAEDPRQAEIGFTLAREAQGQGYATEAARRLLDYLFREMRLHRVRANCDPENGPSARVLQRAGMRHEGSFVESLWFKGRWTGEAWYAILAREWL